MLSSPLATHTEPSPTAIASGNAPTRIGPPIAFPEPAASRVTVSSSALATHTEPSPTAIASGNAPTRIGSPTTRPQPGTNRESVSSAALATHTCPCPVATASGKPPTAIAGRGTTDSVAVVVAGGLGWLVAVVATRPDTVIATAITAATAADRITPAATSSERVRRPAILPGRPRKRPRVPPGSATSRRWSRCAASFRGADSTSTMARRGDPAVRSSRDRASDAVAGPAPTPESGRRATCPRAPGGALPSPSRRARASASRRASSSAWSCLSHLRSVTAVIPSSSASFHRGLPPSLASLTASSLNSSGYGGVCLGT